ncbi:MAG: ATP-binding protein [Chloroflexi bacterium]|nr:ATP-binding protein [Chloroflexota bacterium]
MFKRFKVRNFMCLRDVTVDLGPLTVFVGPNSAGKSALFKALNTFCRLFWYPIRGGYSGDFNVEPGVALDDVVWKGDSSLPIVFQVWFSDSEVTEPDYTIELRRAYSGWSVTAERFVTPKGLVDTSHSAFEFETAQGRKSWPGPFKAPLAFLTQRFAADSVASEYVTPVQEIRNRVGQARRYRPSASDIASFSKESPEQAKGGEREINESGRGLPLVLRDMLSGDRATFSAMEKELASLHSHIQGLTFKRDWRGVGLFYKTSRSIDDVPASLESDGVLLSTFLIWRLYSARLNLKLCLEEPENGVHLSGLKQRYQLLKRFATQTSERPAPQILIATHSRDFLNAIESRSATMDEIRVVEFDPVDGTSIYPLHHYREINQLLTEFKYQVGDLWWSRRLEAQLRQ